jgi:hypothetical protein
VLLGGSGEAFVSGNVERLIGYTQEAGAGHARLLDRPDPPPGEPEDGGDPGGDPQRRRPARPDPAAARAGRPHPLTKPLDVSELLGLLDAITAERAQASLA